MAWPRPASARSGSAPGAGLELALVQRGVEAGALEQLVVGAPLAEPAAFEHDDHVGGENRRQSVVDHYRRGRRTAVAARPG
jgi:hypothetical protein